MESPPVPEEGAAGTLGIGEDMPRKSEGNPRVGSAGGEKEEGAAGTLGIGEDMPRKSEGNPRVGGAGGEKNEGAPLNIDGGPC
ncbi:hypothetical protein GCM10007968_00150 [Sporolactobacillus putidus]|uniref:Uncharacterized protein n=2 Tax=Sporolactobacillus putidus TaxID=492735 RepID=A0A917RWE4_9BACL|nr:hypothetical protein GCM10007968_00150 [Sporolactobacillus putidus]